MTPPALRLNHVSFGPRQARILDGIDLQLEAGHFLGIVGPNGAGKSTLLHIICGLLQPSEGHIDLFGECLSRGSRRRLLGQIRFLPQRQESMSSMPVKVRNVVAMGLEDYHKALWHPARHGERIAQALERTGMAAQAEQDFRSLSGGQQQRVRLARALVSSPRILLLDEPAAALDARAQASLYRLLRELCDEAGMAVVMVEHDIAAISDYVNSVACLNRRIHHHAMRGEMIPEQVWRDMYGEHMHIVAHDAHCIGCAPDQHANEHHENGHPANGQPAPVPHADRQETSE